MEPDLDRRAFLSAGLAAVGVAAVGSAPAARQPASSPRPARLKKAVKIGMVGTSGTLEEKFRLLRELGFDGVELDSPSGLNLDEAAAACEATGLQIPGVVNSVHWSKPLSDPEPAVRAEGLRGLETAVRDCKRLGGTSVLLVPAVVSKQIGYAEAYERSQAEVRKALPLAEDLGIDILMENVWNNFLLSPLEAARYTDELGSARVGWHFDVGNIVNYGWPEHWIRTLGPRIRKLDIKEFSRKKRNDEGLWKGFDVKLGEGDCDWPAVMAALGEIGYEGWATAELAAGDAAYLRDVSDRMDRILAR